MNEYVGTNSSVVLYVDMYSRDQWFDSRWSHVLGLQCAAKEKLQCSCTGTSVRCKRETPVFMHWDFSALQKGNSSVHAQQT